MTNDVKKVPELRFPEFSGEWEEKTLGDVLTILDGDRGKNYPSGTDFLEYGHTLFLNASNVTKNGFSFTLKQYITEKKSISMGNGKLVKDDVVLTTRGSIGNIGWYDEEIYREIPYARINSGMLILRSNNKDMASFVSQFLMSTKGKRQIDRISFGSAQPQLTKKDIKLYRIDFPQIKEQQKIGEFFSKLDQQIELEEQKLEKLEEQKKGYMQQIFSQKLRFKDDNGNYYPEWKEKNLGDISELITKGTTPKNKVNDGSINFIKVENISPINGFITNTTKITEEEHSTYLKRSQLKENDILFSIAGTLGRVSVVKREILPANTNQALAIIRLNAMNLEYIKTYLTGRAIKRFIANNPTVGAQPNMSLTQIRDLIIAIPNLTEQEKIGSFFKKIDNSIKKQSDKIWLLKKRKKGFLQKMFV